MDFQDDQMVLLQPAREFLPVIDKVCVSLVHPSCCYHQSITTTPSTMLSRVKSFSSSSNN